MAVTIRTRRDEAIDWQTANPVLALGELGIETDTDQMKYGDGLTAWNDLPYHFGTGVESDDITTIEVVSALPGTPDANTLYLVI